jgi:nicotinamidase-related amidase
MTLYTGALLRAIDAYRVGTTTRKFGLLVIDEQGEDRTAGQMATAMLTTISFAANRGFTIVNVEINPGMRQDTRLPTRAAFRAAMHQDVVLFKKGSNAFGVVDATGEGKDVMTSYSSSALDGYLRNHGVNELIVLGRRGEMCVRYTVTGGAEGSGNSGPSIRGALDYGYQVWTSPKIIEGDASVWTGLRGVKCYDQVT